MTRRVAVIGRSIVEWAVHQQMHFHAGVRLISRRAKLFRSTIRLITTHDELTALYTAVNEVESRCAAQGRRGFRAVSRGFLVSCRS